MRTLILLFLMTTGCAYSVHQSHTSDFTEMKPGARLVESNAEQFVIMGFVTQTDYANQAFEGLKTKCPGRITGITTRYSSSLGFLSWTNKVHMSGYCVN